MTYLGAVLDKECDRIHAIRDGISDVRDPVEDGRRLGFAAREEDLTTDIEDNQGYQRDETISRESQDAKRLQKLYN